MSTQIQSHLATTLKWGGREIGLRILLNYCLEKTFLKREILRQECDKKKYDNLSYWLHDAVFSDQFLSNLMAKGFENESENY